MKFWEHVDAAQQLHQAAPVRTEVDEADQVSVVMSRLGKKEKCDFAPAPTPVQPTNAKIPVLYN